MDIFSVPRELSEADQVLAKQCMEAIDQLRKEYMERARPFVNVLAELYERYPSQLIIILDQPEGKQ